MAKGVQDFDAMRQDAIRRSREMQRRAVPPPPQPESPPPRPESPPPPAMPPPKPSGTPPMGELAGLLEHLDPGGELHSLLHDWDSEKLILAGVLYLLWKEGADPALLLAIGYILL